MTYLECHYSCILGPQARTTEGEVWVRQVREEQELKYGVDLALLQYVHLFSTNFTPSMLKSMGKFYLWFMLCYH